MTDPVPPKRVAVRITKDAERHLRAGHPWVFEGSITKSSAGGRPGDLAVVFDSSNRFLAVGLWDPGSPIRVKVLHSGEPRAMDAGFLRDQVRTAVEHRRTLAEDPRTTAYRLVHGENDALPGVVVDLYDRVAVLKVYSEAWLPHLDDLRDAIDDAVAPTALVLRLARSVVAPATAAGLDEGAALIGTAPTHPVPFLENGLSFAADVVRGQKTGFFLDQRDNRARVRSLQAAAPGGDVLDVFCCSGGFSVNAAAGGAATVTGVDISAHALGEARANMARNAADPGVAGCVQRCIEGDAFDVMAALVRDRRLFHTVVVDPPSFASRQSQRDAALRGYRRLAELAVQLVHPGGTLAQMSCSSRIGTEEFRDLVLGTVADSGAVALDVEVRGHGADHPVGFAEGAYLKAVYARVERPDSSVRRPSTRRR